MNQERNINSKLSTSTKEQVPPTNNYGSTESSLDSTGELGPKGAFVIQRSSLQGLRRAGALDGTESESSSQEQTPLLEHPSNNNISVMRFVLLLLFLLFSCLVVHTMTLNLDLDVKSRLAVHSLSNAMQGILIVFWKLINKKITGIFIGINVLDTTTNFGQVLTDSGTSLSSMF